MTPLASVAAWTAPATLAFVAARVFAGDPNAPLLVLAIFVAPLVALLSGPAPSDTGRVPAALGLASVAVVLAANVRVAVDLARLLDVAVTPVVVVALVVALGAGLLPSRLDGVTAAVGVAALAVAVALVGVAVGAPPWTAWRDIASRPALVFGDRSAWAQQGGRLAEPGTFAFTESHRVTAMSPGPFRVVEHDGRRTAVRDWQLDRGQSVTVRPGDQLVLGAGAHVRFEEGKRVPGTAPTGPAWADPPVRRAPANLADSAGLAVTVVGGALLLLERAAPAGVAGALGAPALLLVFVLAAASWGVYAAVVAPDAAIGWGPLSPVAGAAAAALRTPAARALVLVTVVLLLLAAGRGLAACSARLAASWRGASSSPPPRWLSGTIVVAGAAALVRAPVEPFHLLLLGLALGAVASASRLAGGPAGARTAGALAGAAALAVLVLGRAGLPSSWEILARYPALAAAPLGWLVGRVAGGPRG